MPLFEYAFNINLIFIVVRVQRQSPEINGGKMGDNSQILPLVEIVVPL